ncbi:MAG: DUF222 domain-containing protein [Acidimicrobiales bacterium]
MVEVLERPLPIERVGLDWVVSLVRSALTDGVEELDDTTAVSDDDLQAEVLACEALRRLVDVAEARRLAELERREATVRDHGLVTHRWLAREALLPAHVAKARVRVGAALVDRFDGVADAVEVGRVSWDHAKAIVDAANPRILDDVTDLQDGLVALAEATVFERWRRELSGIVATIDADGGHDPAGDDPRTTLHISPILDGAATLSGVPGEDAAVVQEAIEAVADELFRAACADHDACPELEIPSRSVLRAAPWSSCADAAAPTAHRHPPAPPGDRAGHPRRRPRRGRHPDGAVLLQDASHRHLVCDADWYPVVVDALGVPLDHGRAVRFATAAQRRAIAVRDGGCAFPGCDAPVAWLDAHHVNPFDHGGRTDTDQLCGLCRRHHRRVAHGAGWTLQLTADGWTWFTSPRGHAFWGQRHGRQRRGPTPDTPDTPDTG